MPDSEYSWDGMEALVERLPTVIAVPLVEYLHERHHPVLVLWHMCDVVELSLRFLMMAGLGEHEGRLPNGLAQGLRGSIEAPTLGQWCAMARAVAAAQASPSVLPELASTVATLDEILGKQRASPEKGLLALRNRLAHGGGLRKEAAARLLPIWEPVMSTVVASLAWLTDVRLIATAPGGKAVLLRGVDGRSMEVDDATRLVGTSQRDALWLERRGRAFTLWPLGRFDGTPGFELAQMYQRRGEVRLLYTVLAGEVALGESEPEAVAAFRQIFRLDADLDAGKSHSVRDFEGGVRQEAARRFGRDAELSRLRDAIRAGSHRLIWLTGPAGIGKSNLVASLATELLDDPPANTLVLPYRFRSGDDRCSRAVFLRFLIERLGSWEGVIDGEQARKGSADKRPRHASDLDEVRSLTERIRDGHAVLLVVDGLDEIAERDRSFVKEVVLSLVRGRVHGVCAGRPEHGLVGAFAAALAHEPFAGGLPSMTPDDVRLMVFEFVGRLRNRVVRRDREVEGAVRNPFIESVVRLSDGLPLYVGYVVQDLASGRLAPESEGQLPANLDAYHEELLRRCGVGDLHAVMTPVVALLALAKEPLDSATMTALLVRRGVLATHNVGLVERALAAVSSMVRRMPAPDSEAGFALYHHSLRTHVLGSEHIRETVVVTRRALAEAALRPGGDDAERYLLRSGVVHLVDEARHGEALALLTDLGRVIGRFQRLGSGPDAAAGWYADWDRVRPGIELSGDAVEWWDFARGIRHHFRREGWDSEKVLLQAALDHADTSPITRAAEDFVAAGRCDWLWLRQVNRPAERRLDPTLAVLAGHRNFVRGAAQLHDGRVLSWSADATLRIWDPSTGGCLAILEGHQRPVQDAHVLPDDRLLSWSSGESSLRLWDSAGGPLAILAGHFGPVRGARLLPDDEMLSWSARDIRIWDGAGEPVATFAGHASDIRGVLPLGDGRILVWSDELRMWSPDGAAVTMTPHQGSVAGALVLAGGRVLTWSSDGTLHTWDVQTGELAILGGHTDRVLGALALNGDRVLSWSADKTLRVWDVVTGACLAVLVGHKFPVKGVVPLAGGDLVSWGNERALRRWDGTTNELTLVLEGHEDLVCGARTLAGGDLLSWSEDRTVRRWDGSSSKPLAVLEGHTLAVSGAVELASGHILSWSQDGTLRVWDAASRADRRTVRTGHTDIVVSSTGLSDGTILSWSLDHTVRRWDGATGVCLMAFQGHTGPVVGAAALDACRIASWEQDSLRIWDLKSGACLASSGADEKLDGALLMRDGRILSWSRDRTLHLRDASSGKPLATLVGHVGTIIEATSLTSGQILSWSADGTLRLWDGAKGIAVAVLEGHASAVQGAIELADRRLASWAARDENIRLWDGTTGAPLAVLAGHAGPVRGVAEFEDGRLLSWADDNALRLWAPSGALLVTCVGHGDTIHRALPLADGRVLSWSADGSVRLWDGRSGILVAVYDRHNPRQVIALIAALGQPVPTVLRMLVEAHTLGPCFARGLGAAGMAWSEIGVAVRIQHLMRGSSRGDWPDVGRSWLL